MKSKLNLVLCSDWRNIAKELRKQLKPHGLTVKFKTRLSWSDLIEVKVSELPTPKYMDVPF